MNKKRLVAALASVAVVATLFGGCSAKNDTAKSGGKSKLKVGMVTDSGNIDDKSFNQGTWEGIQKASKDFSLDTKYLKPSGTKEADYTKEIGNLYDAGYKFIVTPGFKFETAIYNSQTKYKDAKFVLIDGAPNKGDGKAELGQNTVSIFFAEQEGGFLAGVAAAAQLKEGELGFIGGMEIPPVQKYNWGFQQGVKYANEKLGTKMTLKAENIVYQGSFDNSAAGQQLAAQMYDRGVKAIFTAAGGVGVGAINEAKTRAKAGKEAWVIGVDSDQYNDGIYEGKKSAILTSAMKKVETATYDMIKAELDGKFLGGKTLTYDVKNDGIGIPKENPNLTETTATTINDVIAKIKSGEIKVAAEKGDLIK